MEGNLSQVITLSTYIRVPYQCSAFAKLHTQSPANVRMSYPGREQDQMFGSALLNPTACVFECFPTEMILI